MNLKSALAADWGETKKVQDELVQDSEVVSSMIGSSAHLVVAEERVHAPIETVLDTPAYANALIHELSVRRQAADVEALPGRGLFPPGRPFGGDRRKRFQVWPALGGVQIVKLVEEIAATHFDSAKGVMRGNGPLKR